MAYWSHSCGVPGVSSVRVYERSVSSSLYIEWYAGPERERIQRSLKSHVGVPVTSRRTAIRIAQEWALYLSRESNRYVTSLLDGSARTLVTSSVRTLGELLAHYHKRREGTWSAHYKQKQERHRDFWLKAFGTDCPLTEIVEDKVEELGESIDAAPKTRRHYLTYIKAAFAFGRKKLKCVTAENDLSGVELPKGTGRLPSYTREEAAKLLPALEKICDEAGWMGHAAWQSGRRSRALRTVLKSDVEIGDGESIVVFRAANDKAKKDGEVVLRGRAHDLTVRLMGKPGRYLLGTNPPHHTTAIRTWLRKAEKAAGVPHIKDRAWHAFKKRFATDTEGMPGRGRQAGTLESTLRKQYTEDELPAKRDVATHIESIVRTLGSVSETVSISDTQESQRDEKLSSDATKLG